MPKRRLASDIIMDEMLFCGGEWKRRKEWIRHFECEGFRQEDINHIMFYMSQHQPTQEDIEATMAEVERRATKVRKEIIGVLSAELARRLHRKGKTA